MRRTAYAAALGCGLLAAAICGCGRAHADAAGTPSVLRYGYTPIMEELNKDYKFLDLTTEYLSQTLHVKVTMTRSDSYAPIVEALRAGKVDIATIGPLSYIVASEKARIEPLVTSAGADGKPGVYYGVIAVAASSPIRTMQDLKANAKSLQFAFTDVASTSGYLYPRAGLEDAGIDPERDFKEVTFSSNHIATALALKAGKVDAAAMMERIVTLLERKGEAHWSDYRVLYRTGPIPRTPVVIRGDLPEAFKERVRNAYLEMPKRAPKVFAAVQAAHAAFGQPVSAYVPATAAMFGEMRKLVHRTKYLKTED